MRTEKTECRMPNCQRPHIRGECDKNCYYNTRQVMTNADKIRAMSDEELADLYMKAIEDEEYPGWWGNRMGLLAWLKQEAIDHE